MHFLDSLDRLRLQCGSEHLVRLGPRVLAEFLTEVSTRVGGMPATLSALAEYERRLSPRLVRVAGGDRFPPRPLLVVPR
jgi:hypothetical protein